MTLNDNPSHQHQKHTKLARPVQGNFGRNEWAILGAPCTAIKLLADNIITALSPQYKCAYADTSHNDDIIAAPGRLASGAVLEYTDQINHQQYNLTDKVTPFAQRGLFARADLILVNGNHQQAKAQVVIIDLNKQASLQKRVSQLNNVELFLLADNVDGVFEFVKEALPDWEQVPVMRLGETDKIMGFFAGRLQQAKPILNGLVLAGGKSLRMGFDKAAVKWHGKEQRYFMADMLKAICAEVFISHREDQSEITAAYPSLNDTFTDLGPYGAILSALRHNPNSAWLVVACDLPLLDIGTLQYLAANRDASAIATAFGNGFEGLPEPLISIWEPKSYPVLLSYLAQGYSCPRKVLINGDTKLLTAPDPIALTNVNTPEELEQIKRTLHQKIAQPDASRPVTL